MDEGLVFVIVKVCGEFALQEEAIEDRVAEITKAPWGICMLQQECIPGFHFVPNPYRKKQFGEDRGGPQPKAQARSSSHSEQVLIGVLLPLWGRGARWTFGTRTFLKALRTPDPKNVRPRRVRTAPQITSSFCGLAAGAN
jgi:hypothetical protein